MTRRCLCRADERDAVGGHRIRAAIALRWAPRFGNRPDARPTSVGGRAAFVIYGRASRLRTAPVATFRMLSRTELGDELAFRTANG